VALPYNKRVDIIRGSPTRKIDAIRERLAREGRDIILLSTGAPGYPPPRELREWLAEQLMEESTRLYRYTPTPGIMPLREAIVEELARFGGPKLTPENIVATAGGQEAMFASLSVVLEPGDEVLLLDPTYFGYQPIIEYLGGRVVRLYTSMENGFQPDEEEAKRVFEEHRVKAVVIVSPDNPTGRVISEESAKLLADLAVEKGAWIIVDEAYRTLVFERENPWIYKYAPENTIGIDTFSKDPGVPGWRLGFVYAPEWAAQKIRMVSEELVYCPPSFAQHAMAWYLTNEEVRMRHMERARAFLRERRDAMAEALREHLPEARFRLAEGGMFLYVDFSSYLKGVDSEGLSRILLEKASVATVPGTYFSERGGTSLRLSYATETPERIREGVRRIAEVLTNL